MLSLTQAWGTKFFPTALEPTSLVNMIFASAMNLTGARGLAEAAFQQNCGRAAQVARPFAEVAMFVQRVYNKHPEYNIAVLGTSSGIPVHAVVYDDQGCIVFDTYESSRTQYVPYALYSYSLAGIDQELVPLSSARLVDSYKALQEAGLWVDNSYDWHVDKPRGGDYL